MLSLTDVLSLPSIDYSVQRALDPARTNDFVCCKDPAQLLFLVLCPPLGLVKLATAVLMRVIVVVVAVAALVVVVPVSVLETLVLTLPAAVVFTVAVVPLVAVTLLVEVVAVVATVVVAVVAAGEDVVGAGLGFGTGGGESAESEGGGEELSELHDDDLESDLKVFEVCVFV